MARVNTETLVFHLRHSMDSLKIFLRNHSVTCVLLILVTYVTLSDASATKITVAAQKDANISLCVSQIRREDYKEAVQVFERMQDDQLLPRVVREVYSNNVNNTEIILKFLQTLPRVVQLGIGYEAVYGLLALDRQLETPQVVLLDYGVQQAIDMFDNFVISPEYKTRLLALKTSLDANIQKIVRILSNGTSEQVQRFANKPTSNFDYYLFHLIRRAYANNSDTTEMLLKFVGEQPWLSHIGKGYYEIYRELQRNKHLDGNLVFLVGYRIKEAMESVNYTTADPEDKKYFETLKGRLPPSVTNILWGSVCIKNVNYQEYMYAAVWFHAYDGKRRKVFTWRDKDQVKEDLSQGVWKFATSNKGQTFTVKNTHYNEYMYAAVDEYSYGPDRRRVFTWRAGQPDSAYFEWELKYNETDEYVTMKNTMTNEVLFADNNQLAYDFGRRNVFTRSLENNGNVTESSWKIQAC